MIYLYCIIFIGTILLYLYVILNNNTIKITTKNGDAIIYNDTDISSKIKLIRQVINNMFILRNYLIENINDYNEYKEYILLLEKNFNKENTKIYETDPNISATSYSVNKGKELSLCLRSKLSHELHKLDLLMYVGIHEMAHMANPETGHGPLFQKIFKFFITEAIKLGIYNYTDYSKNVVEFCGMTLNSSI